MTSLNNLYLAPFQGVTIYTFLKIYARHFTGVDKFYTPFFSKIDHESRISIRKEHELQHLNPGSAEVVPQILSKDPLEILRFARICEKRGFKELNWNLGCPYPQVADKKRGSGMLMYPSLIENILDAVMPSMPLKFSIKCRLGYTRKDEILELIPIFNQYPIHELTIHGRIGKQLYTGTVDNQAILNLLPLLNIPLVHNGDILTVPDFKQVSQLLPSVKSFMLGRGILCNPFLPGYLKGEAAYENEKEKLRSFIDDLYFAYRSDMNNRLTLLNVLKEYWGYLVQWFDEPQKISRIIKKVNTFEEYEDAVKRVFNEFEKRKEL